MSAGLHEASDAEVANPAPDLAAAIADLETDGYCVVPRALPPDLLADLREGVMTAAAEDVADGTAWYSNGNQKLFMLLNRGAAFLRLAENDVIRAVTEHVLGPDRLLSSMTAVVTRPGNVPQLLHTDQQYVTPPWPHAFTVNAVCMLDAFTEENGGTRVVPGSHLLGRPPDSPDEPTVAIEGPAGSVAFLDGRLWHGSGRNTTTGETRRGILAYYCAPFLRQQENVFRSLRPDVRVALTPSQRRLLGYDIWSGLGAVDGIPRSWLGTDRRSGPTNSDGAFPE